MIIDFNRYNGGGGSSSGVTPAQVQQQIDSALTPYWDSAVTESAITEAVSGLATEQYVQDALSGVSLEGYWTSAETQDAIDENTNTVFPRLPIFSIDWGAAPAEFLNSALFDVDENEEPASSIWLMTETYDWVDNNVDWGNISPSFTIDTENKVAYIENLPAGNYVFNLSKNPGVNYDVFEVWCWDGGDYNHYDCNSTEDAYSQSGQVINDYWKDKLGDGVLIANGTDGGGIWSFPKDVARLEIRVVEENGEEVGQLNITYKPTIDEVAADVNEAFSAISETQQVAAAGLNQLEGRIDELSAATPSVDLSGYYTSAQTEDAISAATSGKADKQNIEPTVSGYFPSWNAQGVITGRGPAAKTNDITINGVSKSYWGRGNGNPDPFYAPLSAGTAGDILVSVGSGAPVWSAVTFPDVSNYVTSAQVETQIVEKNYITSAATANMVTSTSVSTIWKGTQAQYDAIVDKDPYTFYIIVNN